MEINVFILAIFFILAGYDNICYCSSVEVLLPTVILAAAQLVTFVKLGKH